MNITPTCRALLDGARSTLSPLEPRPLVVPLALALMLCVVWKHNESVMLYVAATALYALGASALARSARVELAKERSRRRGIELDLRQLKLRFAVLADLVLNLRRKRA